MNIVIAGPHGAGKTTVGRALAARLGCPFHEELGYALARACRPAGSTAEARQDRLDRAIFEAELARDEAWDAERPRVVETWHVGNLAYARGRSPAVAAEYLPAVRASVARLRPVLVPLDAADEVLAARQHEPGSAAFFAAVGRSCARVGLELGLPTLLPSLTDRLSVEGLVERLLRTLQENR